jgi:hypothetical protein
MNISLPLFEKGDIVDAFNVINNPISPFQVRRYVVSDIKLDTIITTSGLEIEKKNILRIYKKYGILVFNPQFIR